MLHILINHCNTGTQWHTIIHYKVDQYCCSLLFLPQGSCLLAFYLHCSQCHCPCSYSLISHSNQQQHGFTVHWQHCRRPLARQLVRPPLKSSKGNLNMILQRAHIQVYQEIGQKGQNAGIICTGNHPCDSGSGLASVTFGPAPRDVGSEEH